MTKLRQILSREANSWRFLSINAGQSRGPWILPEFIARNGRDFVHAPLQYPYKLRPEKQCFANAQRVCEGTRLGLRYCEGYAVRADGFPLPFHHAWAITPCGAVVDPTLRDGKGVTYCGVVLHAAVIAQHRSPYSWSLFDAGRGLNLPLIFHLDPEMQTLMERAQRSAERVAREKAEREARKSEVAA